MEHLPPWLRNVPLPPRPAGRAAPPTPAPSPGATNEEMPTWLQELQREVADEGADSSGAAASPDWLADLAPPAAPPAPPAQADVASWLDSLGDDAQASEAPPAGQDDDQVSTSSRIRMPVGATDWLRSMGHDPDARSEPLSEPVSTPEESSGVPDWLRDLSDDDVARAIEAEAPDSQPRFDPQAPGWLTDDLPTPDASTVSANWTGRGSSDTSGEQVPDWLHDAVEAEAAEAQRQRRDETPPPDLASSAEVPAWLRELGSAEGPAAEEPPPADDEPAWLRHAAARPPTDRFLDSEEVEVPAWLRDADEPAPAPADMPAPADAPALPTVGADELPSWLRESEAPPTPAGREGAPPAGGAEELPSWLRESEAEGPAPAGREGPPPATGADEVPAWLHEAGPPAPPAPVTGGADEVPAWLHEAGPPAPPAPVSGGADEVPAWLHEAGPPAPPAPVTGGADEVPAWLRAAGPPAPPAAGADELPSWLRESEAEGPAPAGREGPPPAAGADELPSWLRESEAEGPASTGREGPPPVTGADEVPAWLLEAEGPAPAGREGPPLDGGAEEVPAWLLEAENLEPPAPQASLRDEIAGEPDASWLYDSAAGPAASPGAEADVPAWLKDEPAGPPPPPPAADRAAQAAGSALPPWLLSDEASAGAEAPAGPAEPGLPSWLRGVADEAPSPVTPGGPPATPPRRPVTMAEPSESNSFLSGAELPSWLRIPEPERPGDPGEGQALDWLRRLGGPEPDDEPLAAGVAAAVVPQRAQYQRTAEQVASIELLRRISRIPYPEPAVPVAPAPLTRWQRIGLDRVLYALLALALLLALLAPVLTAPLQTATPAAPGASELGALLDGLDSEDVVLVAYEWGAQRSGELRPLEAAVASRLIANKTKLILVSTDLQGTLLAFDLVEPLRAAGYNNEQGVNFGGRDYVLLGYRPGGELALRGLVQDLRDELSSDFDGQDATQSLVANNPDGTPRFTGINDLSMILVMADQPQDVQAWMEQVYPAAHDVPIAFLLPQEAQPLVQPYLRLPNVYHLAGQQGALALAAGDGSGDAAMVARSTGQLWFAVAVFLVLLAAGAVAGAVSRGRSARGGAA